MIRYLRRASSMERIFKAWPDIVVTMGVLFICTAGSALLAAEQGETGILGPGAESCSVYMTTYEHNPDSIEDDHEIGDEGVHHEAAHTSSDYILWLQGYLSAYKLYGDDAGNTGKHASNGTMLYFLYRRCSETPDAAFYTVIPALLERLNSSAE